MNASTMEKPPSDIALEPAINLGLRRKLGEVAKQIVAGPVPVAAAEKLGVQLAEHAHSAILRTASLCWVGPAALGQVIAGDRVVVQSADVNSEDRRERIAEAQESQRKLDKTGQRLRRKLQDAMAILPRELELEASGKVARVRREYEHSIAEGQLDDLAGHLITALHEAREELFEMLDQRLSAIVEELRDDLEECGADLGVGDRLPDRMPIEISPPDPDKKGIDLRDLVVAAPIAVVGVMSMNPILMAGGASVVLVRGTQVFDRSRKERARKQLADICSDFQRQLSLVLHQVTVEVRSSLTSELDETLGSRRSELVEEIRSLEALEGRAELSPSRPRSTHSVATSLGKADAPISWSNIRPSSPRDRASAELGSARCPTS